MSPFELLPYMRGSNLRELGLRERTGVQVLLVRGQRGEGGLRVANPVDRFEEGQTLVIAGTRAGISQLESGPR